jgi:hypothetical protein
VSQGSCEYACTSLQPELLDGFYSYSVLNDLGPDIGLLLVKHEHFTICSDSACFLLV